MSSIKLGPDHATAAAFDDPKPGDRFHEMCSYWVIVVEVEDGRVTALAGAGPLNWQRGRIQGSSELIEPFQERAQVREFPSVEAFKAAYAYGTIPGYPVRLADRGIDVTIAREHIRATRASAPEVETPTEHLAARISPADELRSATASLAVKLPDSITMIPRIVMGDSETMSALAFCEDHTNWNGDTPPADPDIVACWNCLTVEVQYQSLAELIRRLLAGREAFASLLGLFAAMYEQRLTDTPGSRYATDVARAILGSRP